MHIKSYKYPKLNDKKWLYQKYIVENMGTKEIAKLSGAKTSNSARQALIRNNIKLRNISEGLTIKNHDDDFMLDLEVIDGCLLGDGYMISHNRNSDLSYPFFAKKNIYEDHVKYVASFLFPETFNNRIKIENAINPFNGSPMIYYRISTLSRKELLNQYRRWYSPQNNFKKVVPQDLVISKKLLLHWFMDDGCTIFIRDKKLVETRFCAMGFQREEQEFLIEKIKSTFDLTFTIRKASSGSMTDIWAPSSQIYELIKILGPCPVKNMEYKWKLPKLV